MKVTVPIFTDKTRAIMQKSLDSHFSFDDGCDLDAVVSEVLNDRQLFTYLAAFLPDNHGIYLGKGSYWDDITVHEIYGLTLDNEGTPRSTALFRAELVHSYPEPFGQDPRLTRRLWLRDKRGLPSPESFCIQVNDAIEYGEARCVPLTLKDLKRFAH